MKILFLSSGGNTCDYQRDALFHGLRTLLGSGVVDVHRIDTMYKDFGDVSGLYGRGMTLYGLLGDDSDVDRTDIPRKIANKYFDIVLYGSVHRCQDYLQEVASMYDPRRVIFIDGEDHAGYLQGLGGIYLKRELYNAQPNVWPIHFAIPAEKILSDAPIKSRLMAPCDPLNRKTYIYKTEQEYYAQYADSYYAPTMKKAGWEALRHEEILSQWCLPYFRVMDQLPNLICHKLPRLELMLVKSMVEYWADTKNGNIRDLLIDLWAAIIDRVMKVVREELTTVALAKYVLNIVGVKELCPVLTL